jgi:hypothetical protein
VVGGPRRPRRDRLRDRRTPAHGGRLRPHPPPAGAPPRSRRHRPAHRARQPPRVPRGAGEGAEHCVARGDPARPDQPRPRRLQGGERQLGASLRRRGAEDDRDPAPPQRAGGRHRRPDRRRGVLGDPAAHRRRAGLGDRGAGAGGGRERAHPSGPDRLLGRARGLSARHGGGHRPERARRRGALLGEAVGQEPDPPVRPRARDGPGRTATGGRDHRGPRPSSSRSWR